MDTLWYADRSVGDSWRARGASTLLVPPVGEPVSLAEFKSHSNLLNVEDGVALHCISAARAWLEFYTGRAFLNQTWVCTLDATPSLGAALLLPKSPLISVTSVKSYSTTSVETTMDPLTYFVDPSRQRLLLLDGVSWPSGLRAYNGLVVTYVAGYGTAASHTVPLELRQAIRLLAAHWYEHREGSTDLSLGDLPFGVKSLADPYRTMAD